MHGVRIVIFWITHANRTGLWLCWINWFCFSCYLSVVIFTFWWLNWLTISLRALKLSGCWSDWVAGRLLVLFLLYVTRPMSCHECVWGWRIVNIRCRCQWCQTGRQGDGSPKVLNSVVIFKDISALNIAKLPTTAKELCCTGGHPIPFRNECDPTSAGDTPQIASGPRLETQMLVVFFKQSPKPF